MTKDDPMAGSATCPVMEQDVEILRINLDQPLTDQLVKHSRFAPSEMGDGKQGMHWGEEDKKKYQQSSNGYAASSSSFEIMDLAMRKNPGDGGGARLNSDRNKRAFGGSGTDKTGSMGAVLYNHSAVQSTDFDKFYKGSPPMDYIQNVNGVKDPHKSDAMTRGHNNVSRGMSKCSPGMSKCSPVLTNPTKGGGESTQGGCLPPPLLRTSYDGGHIGANMASAFQRVESHLRDQTMPALYKSPAYPYSLPAMPPPHTPGLFDYPSLSHHLLQPSDHHRSLIPAPSSSQTVSAGSALSPYVLYSDNLMTHQLEVLWQRKYPHHPVPPVWMLYQYMDELQRDPTRVPSREMNPVPRDSSSYKTTPASNSVSAVSTPVVGAMPSDRRKSKKELKDREKFEDNKEVKMTDGRNKEAFLPKQRNDCKDWKWGKQETERGGREPKQNGNAMDWHHHQLDSHLQQQQQRRELLVDESASSACDAVNQHFQESLLRLASQNHVNTSPREATGIIGHSVLSRNHLDDQIIIEKQENIHGNGNHGSWKDGRYAKPDQISQYRMPDDANGGGFSRLSSANAATQVASRNNKAQPDCVSFDLYGYQSKDYSPEKFHGATGRGDICLSKSEKADSRLQMYRQSTPNSLELMASKKQLPFSAAESGKDAKDAYQDLRNSFNASTKGSEKPTSRTVSAKLLNGMNLSTSSQSVASPIPGSIVKDSRLGPSRLIARSPKPLPNVFYNPLDPGFEPVQPCQVSIEPVERWTGTSTWTPSKVTDSYRSGFYMHPGSVPSGFNSFQQTSTASFPTETYSKIQQGLIPNPIYFPGMCEFKQDNYSSLPHRSSVPDFHQAQSLVKTSPLAYESTDSRGTPAKHAKKEEDLRESVKKMRRNSVSRLVSSGGGGDESAPSQRTPIDSFKSFVEQAVYNAFIEDADDGVGREKLSSMTKLIADLETEKDSRATSATDGRNRIGPASKLSSQVSPLSDKSGAEAASSLPSDLTTRTTDEPVNVLSNSTPAVSSCNGQPSSGTLNASSSCMAASDLDMTVRSSTSPAHPSLISSSPQNFPLPPSPPRASGASLHLKKAWLLRYSDNDQKPLSDASSSSFRDEPDNQSSDCSKCSFAEKSSQSPCDSDLVDVAKYEDIQPVQPGDGLNIEKDGKHIASSCHSEDDLQESGSDAVKMKDLKRKATSEPIRSRCSKRARDSVSSPGSNKSELLNGHRDDRKTRSKYSTRLAKMAERSAPSSPRVPSRERERRDSKNTEENDDSCSPVHSDSETKTSRLRKKNRVNNVQTRDQRDSDSRPAVQPKKTARVFLQDAACGEVDPRLTKCCECKAPQSQKSNPNTTNICKFSEFRKLQSYNKGAVSVAGFSEPSDAEKDDIDLWMPLQSKNLHLMPVQARYIIAHLKESFLFLLDHETNADSHKYTESDKSSDVSKIFWRRPIEGVQETCDICDAVVFDVHWTCARCGFVVCIDCHEGYRVRRDPEDDQMDDDDDESDWPTCCASHRSHEPDDLTMTRIIPCDVHTVMRQKLHLTLDSEGDVKSEKVPEDRLKPKTPSDLCSQSSPNAANIPGVCVENVAATKSAILQSSVPCGEGASEEVQRTPERSSGSNDAAVGPLSDSGCNSSSTDSHESIANGKLLSIPRVVLSRSEVEMNRSNKLIGGKDQPTCDLGLRGDGSTAHCSFVGQRVLHLTDDTSEGAIDLFQSHWKQLMPIVVSNCNKRFQSNLWRPEVFAKRFSHLKVDLISCLTGAVHRFQSMEKFWTGSKHLSSAANSKTTGLLQFKDWPLSDDWTGELKDHNLDLRQALPFNCYTLPTGPFNLASHLPEFFPQPDLITRIIVGHGNVAQNQVTLAKLQMNPVDFVNVVMHAENKDSSSESFAANIIELMKESGVHVDLMPVTKRPETVVAVWHTYSPQDTDKIKTFVEKNHTGSASSPRGSSRDLSNDVGCYLDSTLQDKLLKDFGVQPSVVVQCLGDAVFIPAMAFYQVKVIQDCILVSREFISPESIQSSFDKSLQLKWSHSQNKEKHDRQNHLQIKNLVYHTVKDCIATLGDAKS